MKSHWRGEPDWPEELCGKVAERLVLCKEQLTFFAVEQMVEGQAPPPTDLELEDFLQLDARFLAILQPHQVARAQQIADEAERDIEQLLTPEQTAEFRAIGMQSMLGRVDYVVDETEVMRKINGLGSDLETREDYSEYFCERPFEYADIGDRGQLNLCCGMLLPESAGDFQDGTFMEVWNSEKAQEIRRTILDGTYSKCLDHHCPQLKNKTLLKRKDVTNPAHREIIDNNKLVMEHGPRSVVLSYDKSCNLACRTCRVQPIMLQGEARTKAEQIQDWATAEHLADARELNVTLSGDAFGSPIFFNFLREFDASRYPDLRITLCTNGLGLTERNWQRICNEIIGVVYISIDAATPETYAINRGGDFDKLMQNLRFVSTLITRGEIEEFTLSFVVQANNYHEMPAFVELGEAVNATSVVFIQIGNSGVFTHQEFERRAVHLESHPEHEKFLEVLQDPRLRSPIAQLRTLASLRREPDQQEALLQAVEMIRGYSRVLTQAGIDGTEVLDDSSLPHSKTAIRSALDVMIAGAHTEQEKENLANARQTLAFFQPDVPSGRAALDTTAFDNETWGSVVRAEMSQQQ